MTQENEWHSAKCCGGELNCCKGFEEESSEVWAVKEALWRRVVLTGLRSRRVEGKNLFQDHTFIKGTELEETLVILIHLVAT